MQNSNVTGKHLYYFYHHCVEMHNDMFYLALQTSLTKEYWNLLDEKFIL